MESLSESDCGEYSMQSGQSGQSEQSGKSRRSGKPRKPEHKTGKWHFYERVIEVPRYVIFDPASAELEVYALRNNRYEQETADSQGRYLIPGLNLFLGVWEGTHEIRTGPWLRWWTTAGELVPWSEEKAQQAEEKAQQAEAEVQRERQEKEALLAKLRAAGLA
ncbi:MAG: hypothetical protein WA885_04245 [Phormidesmis sp.]